VTTIEPVTVGGWYAHTDGTVGRYSWSSGCLSLREVAADWTQVRSEADRIADDVRLLDADA